MKCILTINIEMQTAIIMLMVPKFSRLNALIFHGIFTQCGEYMDLKNDFKSKYKINFHSNGYYN